MAFRENAWYAYKMIPQEKRPQREITAGFIVYRKTPEGPKFLILYHRGDYWNFPKGHIESEEKSLTAALRETKEETGITSRDLRILDGFKAYERFYFKRAGQSVFKIVIFYLAETHTTEVKISDEHQGYGWFLFRDAQRMLGKYRDSRNVLKSAYDFLHGKSSRSRPAFVKTSTFNKSSADRSAGRPPHPPRFRSNDELHKAGN